MDVKLIYSPGYDFMPMGFDSLHPFDGKKFTRAWKALQEAVAVDINSLWIEPEQPVTDEYLHNIHTPEYIHSLNKSSSIARILEITLARFIPNKLLQSQIITPMRLACEGTRLATQYALGGAIAMNIGGGFHHAFADHGEGFCVFADAALAIEFARKDGLLNRSDNVAMIDLDAHRGNGFQAIFERDTSIHIFDMFNFQVYPGMYEGDIDACPFLIPLKGRISDDVYLDALKSELPRFLQSIEKPKLVFYNAGTDILASDPLGNLGVNYSGVVERDRYVIDLLASLNIPTVVMTSGGYTDQSYKLIAELAKTIIRLTL